MTLQTILLIALIVFVIYLVLGFICYRYFLRLEPEVRGRMGLSGCLLFCVVYPIIFIRTMLYH